MIALFCLCLALFVSPFKSKSRLEAENVALRHQLIILRRKVRGRIRLSFKSNHEVSATVVRQRNDFLGNERPVIIVREVKPLLDLHIQRFAWFGQQIAQVRVLLRQVKRTGH